MSLHGPRALQLILRFPTGPAPLSLASPGGALETSLGLRRLPLHHVLGHKHGGGPLLGNVVDLTINQYHDDTRGKEGHEAGGQDVPRLVVEKTLLPARVIALLVVSFQIPRLLFVRHEERRRGDDDGYEPHDADHRFNPLGRPFAVVAHGFSHGPVAVEADGAEMDDGGSAKEDVQSQVEGAPGGTKVPVAHHLQEDEKPIKIVTELSSSDESFHILFFSRAKHLKDYFTSE